MSVSKRKTVIVWVVSALLALLYLAAAAGKLSGAATPMFTGWGYPAWFATLIGAAEAAGAIGLLVPKLRRWAILGLALVMLGAVYTHLANGEGLEVLRPIVFTGALGLLWRLDRAPAAG